MRLGKTILLAVAVLGYLTYAGIYYRSWSLWHAAAIGAAIVVVAAVAFVALALPVSWGEARLEHERACQHVIKAWQDAGRWVGVKRHKDRRRGRVEEIVVSFGPPDEARWKICIPGSCLRCAADAERVLPGRLEGRFPPRETTT